MVFFFVIVAISAVESDPAPAIGFGPLLGLQLLTILIMIGLAIVYVRDAYQSTLVTRRSTDALDRASHHRQHGRDAGLLVAVHPPEAGHARSLCQRKRGVVTSV